MPASRIGAWYSAHATTVCWCREFKTGTHSVFGQIVRNAASLRAYHPSLMSRSRYLDQNIGGRVALAFRILFPLAPRDIRQSAHGHLPPFAADA
jgi:hypothetical protein